jgi:hypothetical protein
LRTERANCMTTRGGAVFACAWDSVFTIACVMACVRGVATKRLPAVFGNASS